jgi:DNA-binding XRE family transcriptional regulator
MEFKDKVRTARLQLFMSQETFAKELGVAFVTVNRWENGKYLPGYDAQKKFHDYCKAKGIKFEE